MCITKSLLTLYAPHAVPGKIMYIPLPFTNSVIIILFASSGNASDYIHTVQQPRKRSRPHLALACLLRARVCKSMRPASATHLADS